MEIVIEGVQERSVALIRDAIQSFAAQLLPLWRLEMPFTVTIRGVTAEQFQEWEAPPDVAGGMWYTDEVACSIDAENFLIVFNPRLSPGEVFVTLAHEMAHLAQYRSGNMVQVGEDVYWHGEKVDLETIDYFDLPWEVEAYGIQDELVMKMMKAIEFERRVKEIQDD